MLVLFGAVFKHLKRSEFWARITEENLEITMSVICVSYVCVWCYANGPYSVEVLGMVSQEL